VRIGCHLPLMFGCSAVGLWAFGLGSGLLLAWADVLRWTWPAALIIAGVGGWLGHTLARRVAVRCPSCGGRAYYEVGPRRGSHYPIRYRCRACGDVHPTGFSEGR
jgi:hypothetical protein